MYAKFNKNMNNHLNSRRSHGTKRSEGSSLVKTGRNVSSSSPKFLVRKESDRPRFNRTPRVRSSNTSQKSPNISNRSQPQKSSSYSRSNNDLRSSSSRRKFGSRSGNRSFNRRYGYGSGSQRRGKLNGRSFSNNGRLGGNKRRRSKRGEDIDISRFVKKASENVKLKVIPIKHQFADFDLGPKIKKNLQMRNFKTPTPIQDQSIPHILKGRDVVGLANTGTGKTGAFLLPLIKKVLDDKTQRVLILAPTRELANQIEVEFREFAKHLGIYSCVCIGGAPIFRQIKSLKRRPHFIIGTPGRIKDLHKQKELRLDNVNNIVLDEVDRMLDMGFVHEIREILSHAHEDRQSLFFSATMPAPIKTLVNEFLNDPITIETQTGITTDNVEQDIVEVDHPSEKFDTLLDLLVKPEMTKVLIFAETKRNVEKVTKELIRSGIKADSIHGDKRQRQREKSLNKFRTGRVQVLIATDVAARGLDIKDVSHVINYTVPQTYDDYVHRIGRTGRANQKGHALTFIS